MPKSKLQELLAQRAELEKQIAHTQRSERADAIAQVRMLMSQYGLTLADMGSKTIAGPKSNKSAIAPPAVKAPKSSKGKKTGKVAPKYRDAITGQTWSGRGLQPNWLKAALATGRGIAEFKL